MCKIMFKLKGKAGVGINHKININYRCKQQAIGAKTKEIALIRSKKDEKKFKKSLHYIE